MKSLFKRLIKRLTSRSEKGNTLVLLAAGVVPLVATMGLVIDYGTAAACKAKMQKAVDAAALAGAAQLPSPYAHYSAWDVSQINYQDFDNRNVAVSGDRVEVEMYRAVPTYFMRIFGKMDVPVLVDAAAVGTMPVNMLRGHMMPFALINPNTNNDPTDDLVPGNYGKEYILFYGEDNIMVQDWANGDGPAPSNPGHGGGNSTGWRSALRLNSDGSVGHSGAADFRHNIENGWLGEAGIGDILPTYTGNITGPNRQGRENRIGDEEFYEFPDYDPDTDYDWNRVVYVPIISLLVNNTQTQYTMHDYDLGNEWDKGNVIIDGFAPFYLTTVAEQGDVDGDGNANDTDWIVGKFIPGTRAPKGSDGDNGGIDFGTRTIPRLVD